MNAIMIMRTLLLAHQPALDIVADRVMAGDVPEGDTLPAVGLKEISRNEQDTVSRASPATLVRARVQVTVYTKTYPQQKQLLDAVKLGPGTHTGTIAGAEVRSVLRDAVGPDMGDAAAGIYEQSRDFIVTYLEPN
jgi:hypothetical protein